ncbi:gamma-glutamyltransferase family protein [Salinarimonas ramus]|uniref:Gamma-glutamyltransferase n=1 Tax=Salinarimonas ramus TaxID=690164 RepID=A0A917V2W5_9HYPH|nr:gamma-glutamyltransferase [Salinarimonas ramus]GGK26688.1 gamma-glutamyltransferase [Salinarimonas ramus]
MTRLETPTFSHAAVAAPHAAASEAGRAILIEGGNAVEAMIAMAATIAVVYPHMNGIGGDAFWCVSDPNGRVHAIDAAGFAGSLATPAFYRDRELETIPTRGPLAALTVPGTIDGWRLAGELARARGGRLPLETLLADAIRRAREGVAVAGSEARLWADGKGPNARDALLDAPGFREAYLVEGEPPEAGALRRAPALADTLAQLAHAGLRDFYSGDVAREIAADLERIGAPVTREDLRRYEARVVRPLSLNLPGLQVFNLPPPSQGLASLAILGIAERLALGRVDDVSWHHGLVESVKRAFAIRDHAVRDPARLDGDPQELLADASLAREAAAISMSRAAPWPRDGSQADTIWMGAIDGDGLAVSFIQSLYWEYGSGCVLPSTGITLQNRGAAFSLARDAVNPLAPGRKPFHTLNPAIARFADGRVVAYGCMGGDGQPQTQAQVITRYRAGANAAEAVDAPRWLLGRTWGDTSTSLKLEARVDESLVAGLRRLGHRVEVLDAPYSDTLGHAGLLAKHPGDGRVEASHDPRSDGAALGL